MDNIDVYCNILYVMDKRTKLSKIAHDFLSMNKNSPEVCYLVGARHVVGLHSDNDQGSRESLQLAG